MLDDIKSSFFIRECLSILGEKRKLELIKYNNNLQNILNINIMNYKIFSGKYIIYKSNSFAQEFSLLNDELIFEGEYLNGKRNGKGKEYDECFRNLIFEGEYLNGKRCGNGKEYDYFTRYLIFEGEYLNGKRNGKGKEYNQKGFLIFEGEYYNDKRWNGKGYNKNNTIYEMRDGKGYLKEYNIFGGHIRMD